MFGITSLYLTYYVLRLYIIQIYILQKKQINTHIILEQYYENTQKHLRFTTHDIGKRKLGFINKILYYTK